MTTQPHDQFTKELLGELLAPLGEVEPDLAIKGQGGFIVARGILKG